MASFVFNIAKGRVIELYNRVDSNDPANSALIVIAIDAAGTSDATMKDVDTFAALISAGAFEVTSSGWARKTLTDVDLAGIGTPDDAGDLWQIALPDQTWTTIGQSGAHPNWTDLIVCYDGDTTAGTDANLIPLTCHDFPITPDGSDITADFAAVGSGGFFQAS
jgi:hypothetical protein